MISQLEAELWTFFDEILRNCEKRPFFHVFWQFFGYGQKSFSTTNFILLMLTFQIICNVCCKGERYPFTGLVIVFSWKIPIFWNFPNKLRFFEDKGQGDQDIGTRPRSIDFLHQFTSEKTLKATAEVGALHPTHMPWNVR